MSWSRISFTEDDEIEETLVSSDWIKDGTLLWPYGVNATKTLKEKRQLSDDWEKYIVKSIKLESCKTKVIFE